MSVQRGSSRLNVHRDDEPKHEPAGAAALRASHRAEEWHDPEPEADDDPRPTTGGPVPPKGNSQRAEAEALRSDLARHLGRGTFPADRHTVVRTLMERNAPDELVKTARDLPSGGTTGTCRRS